MAKSESMSMNISSLKLKDPYFKEILDMGAHVVLYNYNPEIQNWEKTEVEGAFFVYSRTNEPQYYALIMNRLSTSNHIEHIDENVELQRHEPFILLKNAKGTIHGIWFYVREECCRIATLMERLSSEIAQSKNIHLQANNSSLTSGAETSKRVMDFFARAGGKAPMSRPPPPMAALNMSEVNPLVQRLLSSTSNPVQTVEEIEKRQKVCPTLAEERSGAHISTTPSAPITIQRQVSEPTPPTKSLENGISYLRISNDSPTPVSSSIPTQHFFNSSLRQAPSPNPTTDIPLEVSVLERAVIDPTPTSKPALLPPVMFTSNLRQEDQPLSLFQATSSQADSTLGLQPPNSYQPPGAGGGELALTPLTKPQLLQAVNYLLKNDADFLNKLHEAYVKSFVDMVS